MAHTEITDGITRSSGALLRCVMVQHTGHPDVHTTALAVGLAALRTMGRCARERIPGAGRHDSTLWKVVNGALIFVNIINVDDATRAGVGHSSLVKNERRDITRRFIAVTARKQI
jgi:hypothetical protein